MSIQDLSELRQNYGKRQLSEQDVATDPLQQFLSWLQAALATDKQSEPYAMTLATANAQGRPHARTVLLRGADTGGFYFYTNYDSQKGMDLAQNPFAELLFFWPVLEQQVRIHGRVEKVDEQQSVDYFHKRPRDSQLAAHISTPQSGVIESREALDQRFAYVSENFENQPINKPEFWGGYRLIPEYYEFWQGGANRMHDRLRYSQQGDSWRIERLMP